MKRATLAYLFLTLFCISPVHAQILTGGAGSVSTGGTGATTFTAGLIRSPGGTTALTSVTSIPDVLTFAPTARTSGSAPFFLITTPADTTLAAAAEAPGILLGGTSGGGTVTRQFSGNDTVTLQREIVIPQITYTGSVASKTFTLAASLSVVGVPIRGTNVLGSAAALNIEAGNGSTWTNATGLVVNAPAGATNNYPAAFLGGNIGIGTSTPASILDIEGASSPFVSVKNTTVGGLAYARWLSTTNGSLYIGVENSAGNGLLGTGSGYDGVIGTAHNTGLRLITNNATRMSITNVGNVGVATNTFGTAAVGVLGLGTATAPTTSPVDVVQLWAADINAVAGEHGLHIRDELGGVYKIGAGIMWASGTKPTCASGIRGTVYYVAGGAGVLDTFEVCRKDAADAYAWVSLF